MDFLLGTMMKLATEINDPKDIQKEERPPIVQKTTPKNINDTFDCFFKEDGVTYICKKVKK
jgi:hypothetical protein